LEKLKMESLGDTIEIENLINLTHLKLSYCYEFEGKYLYTLKKLKYLEIIYCSNINDHYFKGLDELNFLEIRECNFKMNKLSYLIN
jgi:hypothetical protein